MWWRWQQAEEQMHAYDRSTTTPGPGRSFTALCGADITPREHDFHLTGWPQPTCWRCDREIRVRDGWPADQIPPLTDTTPPTPRNPTDHDPPHPPPTRACRAPRTQH